MIFNNNDNMKHHRSCLSKMHAKVSKFKYLFHPVSTKFPVNIEQHMLFVFGIATFWHKLLVISCIQLEEQTKGILKLKSVSKYDHSLRRYND